MYNDNECQHEKGEECDNDQMMTKMAMNANMILDENEHAHNPKNTHTHTNKMRKMCINVFLKKCKST